MKISVYAIAKNEEKFAHRWARSMSEADEIIVLDTGSEDKTVEILSSFPKVRVFREKVSPWRFDTARNMSLRKVSDDTDYCVCTDLDEIFTTGWRENLEKVLTEHPDRVSYRYVWSFNKDGSENTVFNLDKIHKRQGFIWTHPVHEVLTFTENRQPITVFADNVELQHYPDEKKSRGIYLPLLELSVKEAPEDDRNMHYLGREYMFYGRYDEAIRTFRKHLSLEGAKWKDERCASLRYMARCFQALQKPSEALQCLLGACAEAPYLREPWMEAAEYFYKEKNYYGVITFVNEALKITKKTDTYITVSEYWGSKPYDLLSLAYYYTGDVSKAEENARTALTFSPYDERIRKNLIFFVSVKKP